MTSDPHETPESTWNAPGTGQNGHSPSPPSPAHRLRPCPQLRPDPSTRNLRTRNLSTHSPNTSSPSTHSLTPPRGSSRSLRHPLRNRSHSAF